MSLIRKHVAVLQAWACLDLVRCVDSAGDLLSVDRRCGLLLCSLTVLETACFHTGRYGSVNTLFVSDQSYRL